MSSGTVDADFQSWAEQTAKAYWQAGIGVYTAVVLLLRTVTNTSILERK